MYQNRINYLVSTNNYPLVPANTVLFNQDGSLNIVPGQLGIFDANTHTAVSTFTDVKDIYLAVGVDTNGDGVAEEVRKSASTLYGCSGLEASAEGPQGECPEIWDFLFDCTTCEKDYGIKVQIESTHQAPYFHPEHLPTYPFNVITECCGCDECTTEHNCNEIVCKILEQIHPTKNDMNHHMVKRDFDFTAERLYPTISHLALPCTTGECGGEYLCKLDSVTVVNNGTTYVIPTTVVNPTLPGTMLIGQVKVLENQLNAGLTTNNIPGKFHVTQKCSNTCFEITLNSCAEITAASFSGCTATITTEHPLTVTTPTECNDCTDAGTTSKTYSCGIRFIGKIIPQECGCFPPVEYTMNRGTRLRVFPTTGFECNSWATNQIQQLQYAENQGVDIRWEEYKQEIGGTGRAYAPQIMTVGKLGAHLGRMTESINAKCVPYCSYSFKHLTNRRFNEYGTGTPWHSILYSVVEIPESDSTTRSEFEAAINSWINTLHCPIDSITCVEKRGKKETSLKG
jgi:hypothetical protein